MSGIASKILDLINAGQSVSTSGSYYQWAARVESFLARAINVETADHFRKLCDPEQSWVKSGASQIGLLEGLAAVLDQERAERSGVGPVALPSPLSTQLSKRVFVVHGRDIETKESVARFLERLGLEPIVLHEQPNSGRTVIEKFEVFADVGFAVVLLTADDVGGLATAPTNLGGRARQNVILELGYFLGRLSRRRVCALYKKGVEIPSDYQGVLYVEFDPAGAWRTKLAQELVEVGFSINHDALLKF